MPAQKFALADAHVLTNAAVYLFCEKDCLGHHECFRSHDRVAQRQLREIALRLAQRGYGPPKKREART